MAVATREFAVIEKVAADLSTLNKGELRRAINWLVDYFDVYDEEQSFADASPISVSDADVIAFEIDPVVDDDDEYEEPEAEAPETFADFYALIAPKTAIQKAVTAAYWVEKEEGASAWKSFEVNKLLRQTGIKISSISGTLAIDEKKDVPFVEQLSKSGDSMQARKTFRLTDAGIAYVEGRM